MTVLGTGLSGAGHHEDALAAREAELAMMSRLGTSESNILVAQGNLANTYHMLGRHEEALRIRQEVYAQRLKLSGKEHVETIREALCYALVLIASRRFNDAKTLTRKTIPAARRVLGNSHEYTLRMRSSYARALYEDDGATLEDLREAVETLEDAERIARRVLGGVHPITEAFEDNLQDARDALRDREETRDAFRTARAKLAQERAELAKTLADAIARLPK